MHNLWNSTANGIPQGYAVVYLLIAALCLVIALRQLRRVLVPLGAILQAFAATAAIAIALSAGLGLIVAAILSGR